MSRLTAYWRNTEQMPIILCVACRGGMLAGPLLLVMLAIPGVDWRVDARSMSYGEVWNSGVGLVMVVFLGLVTVGSWGMAARRPWSRWALVLTQVLVIVPIVAGEVDQPWVLLVQAGVAALIIYAVLFHLPSIRTHFESG